LVQRIGRAKSEIKRRVESATKKIEMIFKEEKAIEETRR
jgi:hypothetical protein